MFPVGRASVHIFIYYFSKPPLFFFISCFQSEFPDHPVDTPERLAAFLKYFEMEPPVLGVGTLVSHDPVSLQFTYCDTFRFDLT